LADVTIDTSPGVPELTTGGSNVELATSVTDEKVRTELS
jgi:hypothetical protein